MSELSFQNIEDISSDIHREEISYSHLADELIDHLCCDVEYEMQKGLSFNEAYKRVRQKMGSARRIKEIQEETLYAVDSKYRNMKKTMKISGIAGTILFGIATLFKIQHWPMAGVMLSLGAFILAFIFMPSTLVVLWKETHNRKRLVLFVSGFVAGLLFIFGTLFKIQHWPQAGIILSSSVFIAVFLFIPSLVTGKLADPVNKARKPVYLLGAAGIVLYVTGSLFKIQHWPWASILMVISLIILFVVALPWYTRTTWKDEDHTSPVFIFIIIGSLLIILPGALINLNLRNMYINGYYSHLDQEKFIYTTGSGYNAEFMNLYRDSACFGQMQLIHAKANEAIKCLENTEKQVTGAPGTMDGTPSPGTYSDMQADNGPGISYTALPAPFSSAPARNFLMPGCPVREALNDSLQGYLNFVTDLTPGRDSGRYRALLDPSIYLPAGDPSENSLSLLSVLHTLGILKNNVLAVEAYMLTNTAGRY